MAKMNLLDALQAALTATKTYIDDNHYNQTEIDAMFDAVDTALEGKANSSHGTHVTWATNAPKANGTAAVGTVNRVAREDHVHPLQTTVSGNAGSANKVNNAMKVQLNGGTTEGTNQFTFDGSAAKTVNITPAGIGASASGHNHDDRYFTETEMNTKINTINTAISTAQTNATNAAKSYTDTAITNLVNSAPDAMNTLKELADAIDAHQDVYDAYVEEVSAALAGKADKEHGTHLTLGTGSSNAFRGDYGNTAYQHSQAAHAPSNAEKNQNAFSNVTVGSTTVAADTATDTLTLVAGTNVQISADATNDKITISATDTVYTHPNSGATAGSYGPSANATPAYGATFNVPYLTVNAAGHVTAISTKTVKIPASDNTWRGIQNNLTSTSTTDSLSANQGKVLKDLVDTKADMVEDTELTAMLAEVFGTTEA